MGADAVSELPPGFVLTPPQASSNGLPPGFVLAAPKQDRSTFDVLTGADGGERYQTWPERAIRGLVGSAVSAATLPGDVYRGRVDPLSDEAIRRSADLASLATPINPAVRAGDMAIPGMARAGLVAGKARIPTAEELKRVGAQDINAARQSGLDVSASAVADRSRKLQQELFDAGVHPVDAPATYAKLKELESAPSDAIFTASNLQSLRSSFGATAQNFNPNAAKDQMAASRVIQSLDEFLPQLGAQDVLAGSPASTQALFERGRGNYAASQRSNDLTGTLDRARTGILERSEARAQAANSGQNIDNAIRQRVEAVLEKPKEISGFNDAELGALDQVVQGGPVRNTARYLGNLFGGGGGLGQFVTSAAGAGMGAGLASGSSTAALVGAAVPVATGAISKALANQLAKRDLRLVDEMVRMRSPLYEQLMKDPALLQRPSTAGQQAVLRALLLSAQKEQPR